ncbi:GPI-GlcNAc transferase complex, PIG-H component-domain-containing protein [Daldinia grandis]|nr:GPI-GlcNAc transferase complex, PIG-H component-domain-containing protein [Daldinia grandis]
MLTTTPYLRIRRPSPTTAEFIVSTLPPQTLPLRLALGAVYFVRLLLALAVMLMIPVDALATTPIFSLAFVQQTLNVLLSSRLGYFLSKLAHSVPPWVLIPCSIVALYLLSLRIGAEERLLVLRGLGVQTSSSGATVFSALRTRFIPTDKIQDILINEAFRGFEVRHYLIVIVEGEEHIVVVFPQLLPRPRVLEKVWKGARDCLYGRDGEDEKEERRSGGDGTA